MKRSLAKSTTSKLQFMILRNDRSTGQRGGVAFLVKNGLVVNKKYRNDDFNITTNNEALAVELEFSNNQNLTFATIYCPSRNPNLSLFLIINNLSDTVMFVGDFNSKLESFAPILKNIQKQVNFIYLNQSSDILQHSQNRPTGDRWLKF